MKNLIMEKLEEAKGYIRGNKIKEAKSILKELLKEGIVDKGIYLELGKCYLQEDKKKAIENIEKYIELGGEGVEIKVLLAKLYKEIGNKIKSREILESVELNREGLIELFRLNVIEGNKSKGIKNIEDIEGKSGEIREIEEIAREYIKWEEYSRLEKLLKKNKENIEREEYYYYLYKCYKGMDKTEEEIDAIWELRQEKVYEKEIKEEIIKESERGIWKIGERIYKVVEMLCIYTEEDDTDSDTIRALSILLRKGVIEQEKKSKIIEILERYRQKSKKKRAGNIFLNEIEILEKKVVLNSKPRFLTAQLTTKCNLKCPMCWVFKNNYVISDTIFSFIKENIPYLEKVVWQGGEVFLYDKFDELLELAAINGVNQSILTNGLLLNKKRIDLLSRYNIKIKISIDAVDKENYEKIRFGGNFEKLLNILEQLKIEKSKNNKFGYMMAVVINTLNYKKIKEIVEFAVEYGFECITFQNFIVNYIFQDKNSALNTGQAKEVIKELKKIKEKSKKGQLPIKIETNFSLENIKDLLYSYKKIEYLNYIRKYKADGFYNILYFKNTTKDNNDRTLKDYSLSCLLPYKINKYCNPIFGKNQQLFCFSPWTKIYLDINNIMRSVCNGYAIDISKESTDLWNNTKLVEYRKNIVNNNIKDCQILCRDNGEYSYMTLLGVI